MKYKLKLKGCWFPKITRKLTTPGSQIFNMLLPSIASTRERTSAKHVFLLTSNF